MQVEREEEWSRRAELKGRQGGTCILKSQREPGELGACPTGVAAPAASRWLSNHSPQKPSTGPACRASSVSGSRRKAPGAPRWQVSQSVILAPAGTTLFRCTRFELSRYFHGRIYSLCAMLGSKTIQLKMQETDLLEALNRILKQRLYLLPAPQNQVPPTFI